MTRFVPVTEFEVRVFGNRYRQAGVGGSSGGRADTDWRRARRPGSAQEDSTEDQVPVTAFVRIENVDEGIASGNVKGRLELYTADQRSWSTSAGAGYRSSSSRRRRWRTCSKEHPSGYGDRTSSRRHARCSAMASPCCTPTDRGQIPVVLVHGTASSPARWAEMLNELQNDPVLRDRLAVLALHLQYEQPDPAVARNLRDALTSVVTTWIRRVGIPRSAIWS
jgi:hypothetical protein